MHGGASGTNGHSRPDASRNKDTDKAVEKNLSHSLKPTASLLPIWVIPELVHHFLAIFQRRQL
jgi:hypothetical protein